MNNNAVSRTWRVTPSLLILAIAILPSPAAVLAQNAPATCIGAVRDEDGGPLKKKAKVWVVRLRSDGVQTNDSVSSETDAQGNFSIPIPNNWPPQTKIEITAYAEGRVDRKAPPFTVLDCQVGQVQVGVIVLKPEDLKEEQQRQQRVSAYSDARRWDATQSFRRSVFDATLRAYWKYKGSARPSQTTSACTVSPPAYQDVCTTSRSYFAPIQPCSVPILDACGRPIQLQATTYVTRAYCSPCQPVMCSYESPVIGKCRPTAVGDDEPLQKTIQELENMLQWMAEELNVPSHSSEESAGTPTIRESWRVTRPSSAAAQKTPARREWSPLILRDDPTFVRR